MKRTRMTAVVFAAALSLPVLAAGAAQAASEDFRWQGRVAARDAVEIKGVNGPITATASDSDQVLVTAVKKGRKSDPASVKVQLVEHPGGVTICAVYPPVDGHDNVCAPGNGGRMSTRDNDVQVDFHVQVPAGVRLEAKTVNGAISATGLRADAHAQTVNGNVELDSSGTAVAETVNGSIEARMGRADWQGLLKLNTVNGTVAVTLPEGANTDVKASTVNGAIDTDFPLSVSGRISRRSIQGTLGSGGRQLEMNTVNGSIELHKAAAHASR